MQKKNKLNQYNQLITMICVHVTLLIYLLSYELIVHIFFY